MSDVLEFCFRPRCHYRPGDPEPHWFLDPHWPLYPCAEEERGPRPYCSCCGKPRWLAVDADEFVGRFVLDFSPRGIYIEPAGHFVSDGFRSQASDLDIFIIDRAGNPAAMLWDIRVHGERSIREQYDLPLPETCTFGPGTPCERGVCAVCGKENWSSAQLTPVLTIPGDLVFVCRHGHFQGEQCHPLTGMVENLTGPKMLDCLVAAPELFVPRLKWRWWGTPDVHWRCNSCAT